ncbi:hypothetical protein GCM10007928_52660 [Sulfitobacter porphyrae]|nr:hypothetical protein GCM10007928_52660 [Sulfitobacter porphyrae]
MPKDLTAETESLFPEFSVHWSTYPSLGRLNKGLVETSLSTRKGKISLLVESLGLGRLKFAWSIY